MGKKMEDIISRDLRISVKEIRDTSWEDLESRRKIGERAFRPKQMFRVTIHELFRMACFRFKCLLKLKNNM